MRFIYSNEKSKLSYVCPVIFTSKPQMDQRSEY